jgi:hypothetical protein
LFESVAEQQFVAAENFNSRHYNELYSKMEEIVAELKGRDGDQRRELLVLHSHQNDQVRLMSAIHTLAIDYERSRSVLQVLADRGHFPTGMDARGMLRALHECRYITS